MAGKLIQERLLDSLRDTFGSNPTNVDLANRYWNALASLNGHNVRSGGFVIEVYRQAALTSKDGVIALGRAYRELHEESGESPRAAFFDDTLIRVLQTTVQNLEEPACSNVRWILESITTE
jgi:hypothetical protein